ncbi:MAG: DUF4129 domain-containing protein, partial [Anaerolineales bacterium]
MNKMSDTKETNELWDHIVARLPQPLRRSWVRHVLQPLIVGLMVGCIAVSLVQLGHALVPTWNKTYFIVAPILTALAGYYTRYLAKRRFLDGGEKFRMLMTEWVLMFVLLKIAGYIGESWASVLADVRSWSDNIYAIFDAETLAAFGLCLLAWQAAWATVRDIEEIADPLPHYESEDDLPVSRLRRRFTLGGVLLFAMAGLAHTGIAALDASWTRSTLVILSVLVYFLLGLLLLGQMHFARLARLWESRKAQVESQMSVRWVQYGAALLALALVIAFILPTGYTVGLLDLGYALISVIWYLLSWIMYLFTAFFALIAYLLSHFSETEPAMSPATPVMPDEIMPASSAGAEWPWLEILSSLLFWGIAIAFLIYVLRAYLRDRAELQARIASWGVIQRVRAWWAALTHWWRGARREVRARAEAALAKISLRRAGRERRSQRRRPGDSRRAQIAYYYLSTLDEAKEVGLPRRQAQTPYEYSPTVEMALPEAQEEMARLTRAFVEARYSSHPISDEDVGSLQSTWE